MDNCWYYDCARKHEGKGKGKGASCTAKAIVEMDHVREEYVVIKTPSLCDHNHVCDEGRVVKWKIHDEMEKEFLKNLSATPSSIRKKVIVKYMQLYKDKPSIWKDVQSLLAEDCHIDRALNNFRQQILGNMPR